MSQEYTYEVAGTRSRNGDKTIFAIRRLPDNRLIEIGDRISAKNATSTNDIWIWYDGEFRKKESWEWAPQFWDTRVTGFEITGDGIVILYPSDLGMKVGQLAKHVQLLDPPKPLSEDSIALGKDALEFIPSTSTDGDESIGEKEEEISVEHMARSLREFREEFLNSEIESDLETSRIWQDGLNSLRDALKAYIVKRSYKDLDW